MGGYIVAYATAPLAQNNQAVNDGLLLFDTADAYGARYRATAASTATVLGPRPSRSDRLDGGASAHLWTLQPDSGGSRPADTDSHFDIYAYSVASNSFGSSSRMLESTEQSSGVKGQRQTSFLAGHRLNGRLTQVAFISSFATNLDSRRHPTRPTTST